MQEEDMSRELRLSREVHDVERAAWTTNKTTTGETLSSMAYGVEAVLPVEISILTNRVTRYEEDKNTKGMGLELDLLEERCTNAQLRLAVYHTR
ncbi:hypothetical protein L484_012345 [Morus notabilis]|uniref:Uncharacterized protein n=1 Tax=Morus notabilis TaxID=981085 RepID=W9RR21_9ROSA|nr:hypothetical protein L484_012345 [Morus notabilis]